MVRWRNTNEALSIIIQTYLKHIQFSGPMFPEARWVPCITLTQLTLHVMLTVRFMLTLTFQGSHNGLPLEQLKIELKEICFWTTNCCTWVCISTIETKVPEPDADTPGAYKLRPPSKE